MIHTEESQQLYQAILKSITNVLKHGKSLSDLPVAVQQLLDQIEEHPEYDVLDNLKTRDRRFSERFRAQLEVLSVLTNPNSPFVENCRRNAFNLARCNHGSIRFKLKRRLEG